MKKHSDAADPARFPPDEDTIRDSSGASRTERTGDGMYASVSASEARRRVAEGRATVGVEGTEGDRPSEGARDDGVEDEVREEEAGDDTEAGGSPSAREWEG
jgi:hypothetical protein